MSKPAKGDQSRLLDEKRLISGQTNKGTVALTQEGPYSAKDVAKQWTAIWRPEEIRADRVESKLGFCQ